MNTTYKLVCLFFISTIWPQTWQWTGRTHGELDWTTIETEHFRIHHHQGIENIANNIIRGALALPTGRLVPKLIVFWVLSGEFNRVNFVFVWIRRRQV